jgi:excisionase family DNA binding protein
MDYAPTPPRLVTIPEVQRQLSIGRSLVYDLIDEGRLTRVKLGGRALVTQESIDRIASGAA